MRVNCNSRIEWHEVGNGAGTRARSESGIRLPHSRTLSRRIARCFFRKVLECGSPMPLYSVPRQLRLPTGISIRGRVGESFRIASRRAVLIALALLLLLLFEQFVVADFLLRIQNGAKLFSGLLQLLADFRLNRLHQLF